MDYLENAITGYVKRSQDDYPDHTTYKEYVGRMERTPLSRFNEINALAIIRPFLFEWGKMGRVLGQKEFIGWERKIAEQVQSHSERLEGLKAMHLADTELTELKKDIINLYDSFKTIVERVAATKVLHIICPNFFPLWDNAIREAVRPELTRTIYEGVEGFIEKHFDSLRKTIEPFSGEDYYVFMRITQYMVQRYKRTFLELARTYKKGVVKALDDFLWMTAHRPLSLFLQSTTQ